MTAARSRKRKPAASRWSVSAAKSRASKSGSSAEELVQAYNDVAESRGVAFVRKIPTPTKRTKTGLQYTSASTVDYCGFLQGGKAVFLECKCVTTGRLYLSRVAYHQAMCLNIALNYGAAAVLVVVLGQEGIVCEVPWQDARGKVSMSRDELLTYRVKPQDYLRRFLDNVVVGVNVTTGVVDKPKKLSGAEFLEATAWNAIGKGRKK